jgi:hypothetical protein
LDCRRCAVRATRKFKAGAVFLDKGCSPWTILQAAEIEGANVRLCKAEWDETRHPRDPATGRFIETGGAAAVPASVAENLIAGGAMQVAAGVYALAGGALLSLTAAGWVLSHGPKGDIEDGPGYWLPGIPNENRTSARDHDAAGDTTDRQQQCEDLYRIDTDTCRAIARRRGARAGAACYTSASERYAACLAGRPIPPLNTWNN